MGHRTGGFSEVHPPGGLTDPQEAGHDVRPRDERAAGRIDPDRVAEAERLADEDFLVGEGRVDLGDVDGACREAGLHRRDLRSTASG